MYIEVNDYSKKIRGTTVLDHVNVRFESGKIYGLKGKNGSGKTMLMRAISGLITATEGKIIIDGETLGKEISFPRSIGVLIENPAFIDNYTGKKNLEILASIQRKIKSEEIDEAISEMGLDPKDQRIYKKYSLGMKQRLGIVSAIMESPDIIILDEPINALDEGGAKIVRGILKREKERGAIIIIACHDMAELEFLSDEIIFINQGKITSVVPVEKEEK